MALLDVSKMITDRQRLCVFVEWFVRVYREGLAEALTSLFQLDLEEGQPLPDVLALVTSLMRRLRRSLETLIQTETELLSELKEDGAFRNFRDDLTTSLRDAFLRARTLCRMLYGLRISDRVGFPRRVAEEPLALLRQTSFVVHKVEGPEIDPGESLVPEIDASIETVVGIFKPKIAQLDTTMENLVREATATQGKQVAKNLAMKEFDTTFALFVNLLEAAFRLAGKPELAERFRPRQAQRRSASEEPDTEPPEEDDTPPVEDDGPEAPPLPAEIRTLIENQEIETAEEDEIA